MTKLEARWCDGIAVDVEGCKARRVEVVAGDRIFARELVFRQADPIGLVGEVALQAERETLAEAEAYLVQYSSPRARALRALRESRARRGTKGIL